MKKKSRQSRVNATTDTGFELTRTEALLAQLLLHGLGSASQQKKALVLRASGLSNVEIAKLMGMTAAQVAVVLYQARRDGARSAKKPKRTK